MTYPWEAQAKRNEPMPEGLRQSEQLAYQSIALLVARYRLGVVNAEQAVKERKEIDKQYLIHAANEGYIQWTVDFRKRIQIAHAKYRKEPTRENAWVLSNIIDGFVREVKE